MSDQIPRLATVADADADVVAETLAAALETSTPGNVAFYERLGCEVAASYSSPDGLLPVWLMIRQPTPASLSVGALGHH